MTIKYFADRVRETSITTGNGNIVLAGPSVGYYSFINTIGSNKKLTYYIYRQDTNFEWEIGTGYVFDSGGVNILVRERAISSSNNNNIVNFTAGTKYVETIISEERINAGLLNVSEQSGNFTADYISSLYVIDASSTGIQVSLPEVINENYPIVLSFVLNKTIGDQYSQPNAIVLVPSGTETINGQSSIDISIRDDYLQIMSVPSQSGWILLDPIQDSSNPYGNNGSIQVKYDNSFSGVPNFNWDFTNAALLIGGTGTITGADIILPASGANQTIVFNEQSYANDLRIEGTGNTHLFFVDGSENKIAINSTNANDSLAINAQYGKGINLYRSGVGPQITIGNTSLSGLATNDIIGSIVFSGLNSVNNSIEYSKIFTTIENNIDGSESANINFAIIKDGSLESVGIIGASGVSFGFNNSNTGGILIGDICQNEGTNVVLGYYQNICGNNCVAIGHNGSLASGSFGGLIGLNHTSSGNNIWVLGGSGVSVSGNNKTYISIDNNNYATIDGSGSFTHTTFINGNQNFNLYNSYSLSSGIDQNFNFIFNNSSSINKTGLIIQSQIIDSTNLSEDTRITATVLGSGLSKKILSIDTTNINLGNNSVSGDNLIFGMNCLGSGSNNAIVGYGVVNSGNNNIIFGNNISHSGSSSNIFGQDIVCATSGNFGISIFGNNNIANEDYATIFGNNNSASGLYSISIGYLNGVHGEYSVGIGESNLVLMDGSVVIGNSNSLSGLSIDSTAFALGIGNTVNVYNTGLSLGYNNTIYGSGGMVIGQNIFASGNNNIIIGNNTSISGINNFIIGNDLNYIGSDAFIINASGMTTYINSDQNIISSSSSGILQSINNHQFITTPSGTYIYGASGVMVSGLFSSLYGNTVLVSGSSTNVKGSSSVSLSGLLTYINGNSVSISGSGISITGATILVNSPLLNLNSANITASGLNNKIYADNISVTGTNIAVTGSNISFSGSALDMRGSATISLSGLLTNIYSNSDILASGSSINLKSQGHSLIWQTGHLKTSYNNVLNSTNIICDTNIEILGNNISNMKISSTGIFFPDGTFQNTASVGGGGGISDTDTYIIAVPGDDISIKYASACALTPNGNPLSSSNRAYLIIMPGNYSLSSELSLNTQYVDILGYGSITLDRGCECSVIINNYTFNIQSSNIHIKGISVGSQAFKVDTNLSNLIFENCIGGNESFVYAGTVHSTSKFVNCIGGNSSFGGSAALSGSSSVQGNFVNCIAGTYSFGGWGSIVSGTFINCYALGNSFGADASTVSGYLKDCIGDGSYCFGGDNSTISAEFINCKALGDHSFGGDYAVLNSTFTNCVSTGDYCFGGLASTINSVFKDCSANSKSFGYSTVGNESILDGKFYNCISGDDSFGYNGIVVGNPAIFDHCESTNNSFCSSCKIYYCHLTSGTFSTPVNPGLVRLSIDYTDTIINSDPI